MLSISKNESRFKKVFRANKLSIGNGWSSVDPPDWHRINLPFLRFACGSNGIGMYAIWANNAAHDLAMFMAG